MYISPAFEPDIVNGVAVVAVPVTAVPANQAADVPSLPADPLLPFFIVMVELSENVYTFDPPSSDEVVVCFPPVRTVPRSIIVFPD